jgi:predicted aldo/keto reductase-like oxidoreductase
MKSDQVTRRAFIHNTSLIAAGAFSGNSFGSVSVPSETPKAVNTSKILNYNENMEYRRLGKTNLLISAVAMGGHWKRVNVMNQDFDMNRSKVISHVIDVGINYIDACTDIEVKAYSKALTRRRDKMYLALSNSSTEPRHEKYRTAKAMLQGLDELLLEAKLDYTDLWRITALEPGGKHSFNTSCEIVAALETAKKQGKARFGAFSSHDRRWIKFMVDYFPQIDAVLFPYTSMSQVAPKDSIFNALKKHDVGAFGIKPFASNSLFKGDSSPGNPYAEEDDRRARLAIRYILSSTDIIPIPGLININQVDNMVRAIKERRELDLAEKTELEGAASEMWARLPGNYEWLKDWKYV